MKKGKIIAIIATAIILAGAAFAYSYYDTYHKANSVENEAVIYIYRNTDYNGAVDSILNSGILKKGKSFLKAADKLGLKETLKPGRYVVKENLNNKAIVRIFANGWQTPMNFTLSGYIRSWEKLAGYLGARLEADSTAFITALQDGDMMKELGFSKQTYISMFIPNTYELYWTITPQEFIKRMKKEYDAFWNESRTAKAAAMKMTKDEVATLASIVIEETKYEPEMPTIAGVYINRLNKKMLLQADPTVKFALQEQGITRILNRHLSVDSPYNTYLHTGLPPGPITITPINALDAVLNYQHHNYIFFCARETFDGQHNFAATYSEHLRNARAYQKALTAREKAKKVGK
ncbi:MAG: endolytic transglycosylase MltG [Bacteroidales bacterium]|nr:endolytic transglycosylase MltG [Bacteroidales bacterium]